MNFGRIIAILLCVSVASPALSAQASRIKTPGGTIEAETFRIGKITYIYLSPLANAYRLTADWDRFSQVLTLTRGKNFLKIGLGSPTIIVNGEPYQMEGKMGLTDGNFTVPLSLHTDILEPFFHALPAPVIEHRLRRIIVDAGHGGKDPGAKGYSGLLEKNVNLDIARRLKKSLTNYGFEIIMTREDDRFISLPRRAQIANESSADLFISIHSNAGMRSYSGFEVYYLSEAIDEHARALEAVENASINLSEDSYDVLTTDLNTTLWDLIHTENRKESIELSKYVVRNFREKLSTKDRGVKFARFYVLKWTHMPSILVEVGFVTNKWEEKLLKSIAYRQKITDALTDAVLSYNQEYERTNGFSD